MDKETLSNYGWIVICVLVLAVMIALATPFGSYVADGFKAAYKGFGDTNTEVTDMMYSAVGAKAPASCGIEGHYKGDNRGEHGIPATDCTKGHRYTCECVNWVVPEDGKYTMITAVNGKSAYNAGEALPNHYTPQTGDTYEEGDYIYKYDYYYGGSDWSLGLSQNGWGVRVKDTTKATYGTILSEIAGQPVKNMDYTFYNCKSLTTAPVIPNSVTNMHRTFNGCTSLTTAPTIPNSITDMYGTFGGCTSLTTAPVIPSSVTNMTNTFFGCTSLTVAPVIPSIVTNMDLTFSGCTSLTTVPVIPNSVTNMYRTFKNCTSLTTAPIIPNSVTSMYGTFEGCTSLTAAPTIPSSVTNMSSTFSSCTSLTTAPVIPNSVTNMTQTFWYCSSLTGTIEINANPTEYYACFSNTSKPIVLTGSSTMLSQIADNRRNITIQ